MMFCQRKLGDGSVDVNGKFEFLHQICRRDFGMSGVIKYMWKGTFPKRKNIVCYGEGLNEMGAL